MYSKNVERDIFQAVEAGSIYGEGFVSEGWEASAGELESFDENGQAVNTGDLKYRFHEPVDVIRDPGLQSFRDRDWLIVRNYTNKYELAAKYPEFRDKILNQDSETPLNQHYRYNTFGNVDTDVIPYFRFYHSKNPACPEGRYTEFLYDGTVLLDFQLPYSNIPVHRFAPADVAGSSFGYAIMYDLLPLQEYFNMLYSSILTINETFGVPNVLIPKGADVNFVQIAGGMKYIEYIKEAGPPVPMQMPEPPQSMQVALQTVRNDIMDKAGINKVTKGELPSAGLSGVSLALLQSMAIQFNQPAQLAYTQLLEDVGTSTIRICKEYAQIPRIITIAGKYNKNSSVEFTKDKISNIDRVLVKAGSAVTKTAAGKLSLAQMMIEAKVIKMPDEILSVIETGNINPLTQGKSKELIGLQQRCEDLLDGQPIIVSVLDDHLLCINEFKALMADPNIRNNALKSKNIMNAIMKHVEFLTDPQYANLLQVMGQPTLTSQQQPTQVQAGAVGDIAKVTQNTQNPIEGNVNQTIQENQPNMPDKLLESQPDIPDFR